MKILELNGEKFYTTIPTVEMIREFRDEYKDKIKENAYFERGFLFALNELEKRLIKRYREEKTNYV